jgi:gamma-glutamyltranspeptidase/glutathione hydrolase
MSPTLVTRDGELYLALGSPGGSTIITTVAQTLLNVFDFGMTLPEAIDAPRLSNRGGESTTVETNVPPPQDLLSALEARGHTFEETDEIGAATAILLEDGLFTAAAESTRRGGGSAQVVVPQR